MATQRIGSNRITDGEVTGSKLGVNSIGANNFSSAANTHIGTTAAASPAVVAAFNHANSAFGASNTVNLLNDGINLTQNNSITAVFLQSNNNVGVDLTQNTSITAAFTRANNSLDANNGGTVTGSVVYSGVNARLTMNAPLTVRSNLNIQSVTETANLYSGAPNGNTLLYIANNSSYYFATPPTANVTFDLRASSQAGGELDSYMVTGQMISVGIMLSQGATAYRANLFIDGVLQTANTRWSGNVNPSFGGTVNGIDVYSFSVLKRGANSYIILASNTTFANGASSVY
jgi:hypothetical protein